MRPFQRRFSGRADPGPITAISSLLGEIMKLRIAIPHTRTGSRARMLAAAGAGALAITAVAAVAPGGPAARAISFNAPSITVAGGNSVIALQTSENGLRFYWNEHGTNNWHGEQVAGPNTTFSQPAIAQIYIAVEGQGNALELFWQADGASGWNGAFLTKAGTTFSEPSLAQDGSGTIISAEGPSDSLDFYWAVTGSTAFTREVVAGPGTTFSAPAETVNGNSVNIAAEGPSDSLDFYWANNGTSTWGPEVVAPAGSTTSAPAIVANGGGVNIVALNGNSLGSVFYWALNGTQTWNPSTMPGGDTSASSIVTYPGNPGGVHVVAREFFGGLAVQSDVNGSGTWQYDAVCNAGPTGGGCAATAPSATMNGGLVNIAVEDPAGNLDFWWQDSSGNFHEELVDTASNL
jgi:hypothetical protein